MNRMKKTVSFLLIAAMLLSVICIAPFSVSAAGNTWDPANGVYDISTEADLFAFRDSLNNEVQYDGITVNLLNDIEISEGTDYVSPCSNGDANVFFCGTFNGNNHTVSNLNMVSSDYWTVSFFSFTYGATIKDLTLKDVTILNGYTWNAAFVCLSYGNDTISNCHLTGNCIIKPSYDKAVSSGWKYTAGIVGDNYSGSLKIENCSVGGDGSSIKINDPNADYSSSNNSSGGILAYLRYDASAEIISSDSYADIGAFDYSAGIIGVINGNSSRGKSTAKIYDCHNYGNIIANQYITSQIVFSGGIVGYDTTYSNLLIDQCSNHGDIIVKCKTLTDSGGLAGMLHSGAVLNSYNTGKVEAKSEINTIGGLVGHFRVNSDSPAPDVSKFDYYPSDYYNAIINCYNTGDVIGRATEDVGGLCGYVQDIYTKPKKSVIKNAYNFGNVSGTKIVGTVAAGLQDSRLQDVYGIDTETRTITTASIHDDNAPDIDSFTSNVGYFDTPDVTGTVYPATANITIADNRDHPIVESVSSTPLSGNLLKLLNDKVKEYNDELEANGDSFRYLTWKMTNPASEDGSKGVTVHPMFGVLVEQTLNFHVNEPGAADRLFRVYNATDTTETVENGYHELVNYKVPEFYDIPKFAEDDYVFAGWYTTSDNSDNSSDKAFKFNSEIPASVTDVYAHWIPVGEVDQQKDLSDPENKETNDFKILPAGMNGKYKGFELFGVQIRPEYNFDHNYGYGKPGGLRFITSIREDLLSKVDALSDKTTNGNKVEYGFVTASESTVTKAMEKLGITNTTSYKLQYKGVNVNGVDTVMDNKTNKEDRKNANNFRYVTNVDCTSQVGGYGSNPKIKIDHHNYTGYRLATFVVTYDNNTDKAENVAARAYMRYYDANGLLRTFYNDYGGTSFYGCCSTNYNSLYNAFKADRNTVS